MSTFSKSTFKKLLASIDSENSFDFETFSDYLQKHYTSLSDSDVDDIIDFLNSDLGISSDSETQDLSSDEIFELCSFINAILD